MWYRVEEAYYDSRREGRQKTDAEYAEMLERLAAGREIQRVIVDPSAASFIETLRQRGWRVKKADNDVADGIRVTADLLRQRRIVLCRYLPGLSAGDGALLLGRKGGKGCAEKGTRSRHG